MKIKERDFILISRSFFIYLHHKTKDMDIRIIVCANNVSSIGNGKDLLYHLKGDLQRFKSLTESNVVIMGRTTYETLPKKPLQNRVNIILTRNNEYKANDCLVFNTIDDALEECIKYHSDKVIYVIGGGEIYNEFLRRGLVDYIDLTLVNDNTEGSVKFDDVLSRLGIEWEIIKESDTNIDEKSGIEYKFYELKHLK